LYLCALGSCPMSDGVDQADVEDSTSEEQAAGSDTPTPASDSSAIDDQGSSAASPGQSDGCAEPADGEQWRVELLRLVNEQRAAIGLPAVGRSELLEGLATEHACAMITYDFCGHDNPGTGQSGDQRQRDWMQEYGYRAMGEIVARGQKTLAEVIDMWMDSPTHRKVILNAIYTEAGVGVQTGGAYGVHAVMEFACPRDLRAAGN